MFSGKIFFAASLALSSMVATVSAEATAKADCWYNDDCTGELKRENDCTLPARSVIEALDKTDPNVDPSLYMGEPAYFCGNRKSLLADIPDAKAQAIQYCFDIGASSACIWGECDECHTPPPPSVFGDPHFRTWEGEVFDFHGVCDLKFLESHNHNVTIQIRTTQRYQYSYVSSAVIELNGETLELGAWGQLIVNGVMQSNDDDIPKTFGGFPLTVDKSDDKTHSYEISFGDGSGGIEFRSFKDIVGVKLLGSRKAWTDSTGLMGSAVTGKLLARDGETVMEDTIAFGQEWQVAADEKMLFNAVREPQAPAQCQMPQATETARRLGETVARKDAEAACKNWHMNKEACINDVMVTGDYDLAANVY